jgi:tetratricopeptide (TPR) repeat protein
MDALTRLLKGQLSLGAALGLDGEQLGALLAVGRGHLKAGRPSDAVKIFRGLCALEPEISSLRELYALALEAAGELGEAEEQLTAALHRADDAARPEVYAARGLLRVRRGDRDGALADLALAQPGVDGPLLAEVERWMARLTDGGEAWA